MHCPVCRFPTRRVHSYDERTRADLPWAHLRIVLPLPVRKFFGANGRCPRRICTERLPTVEAPGARRTLQLTQRLVALGLALGGKAGVRLSQRWGLGVSRNTLLRVMSRLPQPVFPTPTVLGVDDWA